MASVAGTRAGTPQAAQDAGRIRVARARPLLGALQLLRLHDDHVFVQRLQHRVLQPGAAVEEATLAEVEQQELEEGALRQAIEEPLLVVAARVEIALRESLHPAESG